MSKKIAVFDIDGTLFHSFLLVELVEELIKSGIFPPEAREEYQRQQEDWFATYDDYRTYTDTVLQAFQDNIKGVHFHDFDEAAKRVVERNHNRVYSYARNLIARLTKNNYYLLAISHSPKGILDKFCEEYGFNKVYGMFYELGPSDKFTGEVADEHIIGNKANIVRRACQQEGLSLEGSFGIGDSEDDIPFLELVNRPICFNPTKELYRHAKLNRWPIAVESKGVTYEIPI